ncbi:hypothetical protein RUM43_010274 [Polyplax serrata]|uniref:DNA-directed RNA polymerase III subunit RPC3 n=1 Tax=Polyplax serrata TaxID=468196 RepID=A0AAN8S0C1_POLSC
MSFLFGKLCSLLLQEYFGETVEKVGVDLFRCGPKPLRLISNTTKLTVKEVAQSLTLLINFGLVTFETGKDSFVAEYKLNPQKILLLLRYPKYLMLMKNHYGNEAEIIVEEILKHGRDTTSCILLRSLKRVTSEIPEDEKSIKLQRIRDIFEMLINKQYIKRSPKVTKKKCVPELEPDEQNMFKLPKIDMPKLYEAFIKNLPVTTVDIFWEINFDRFHQDMRDDLMILSTARKINAISGEIMHFILQQMYLISNPHAPVSNPILVSELKDMCSRSKADSNITNHLEDYLAIMTEDYGGFLTKSKSLSAAYEVNLKTAIIEFTWCVLANSVDAKFGPNAARIFRLIREQEFIEQDEIQKKAMLPDKEAKFLTYSLLQSGWIQQHELKKNIQKAGPTKTFYLFYIDFEQVIRMCVEACYKSLYNIITLREQEKIDNKCLLEKKQRIDAIILHMRKEGASDEQVSEIEEMVTPPELALLEKIHLNVNKVSQAELQIDETLFILQLYLNFKG